MDIIEYTSKVLRTESAKSPFVEATIKGLNYSVRLAHAIKGINTEMGEILEAYDKAEDNKEPLDLVNVAEEVGDISWYNSLFIEEYQLFDLITHLDNNYERQLVDITRYPSKMSISATELLDLSKKTEFYGKQLDVEKVKAEFIKFYKLTLDYVYSLNQSESNITIERIRSVNINKLIVRYKDKFSLEEAEVANRDLNTERTILESIQ